MYLQYIKLQDNEGEALWDMMQHNELVEATNGSHVPNSMMGSGGFIITERDDITHIYITH